MGSGLIVGCSYTLGGCEMDADEGGLVEVDAFGMSSSDNLGPILGRNGPPAFHFRDGRLTLAQQVCDCGVAAQTVDQRINRVHGLAPEDLPQTRCVFHVNMIYVQRWDKTAYMSERGSRLRQARRDAGFSSARSAAMRFGWRPSTYGAHENGQNDFDGDLAVEYARAFRVEPEWLYIGVGTKEEAYNFVIPIAGVLANTGSVQLASPEKTEYTSLLFKVLSDSIGFVVNDDTSFPAYTKGQLILCSPAYDEMENLISQECVVTLEDDSSLIGFLLPGKTSPKYDLLRTHARPLYDVAIKRCWYVQARIEKSSWMLTGQGRASMLEFDDPRWTEAVKKEYGGL